MATPATRNNAAVESAAFWIHPHCLLRGWYPVDDVGNPAPQENMKVIISIPGQGFVFEPFWIKDREITGGGYDFMNDNELIELYRRAGYYLVLLSYPQAAQYADSTDGLTKGQRSLMPSSTGPQLAACVAKAIQWIKTWGTRELCPSGGSISSAATDYILTGASGGHILACLVAYAEDGEFAYSTANNINGEQSFLYAHTHRVAGVVGYIGALNWVALEHVENSPMLFFGAPDRYPKQDAALVTEESKVRLAPWYRISQLSSPNLKVGHICIYNLVETTLDDAGLSQAELVSRWNDGIQLGKNPVSTGVEFYTDPHDGICGAAVDDHNQRNNLGEFRRSYWGGPESNPNGFKAWATAREIVDSPAIEFLAADNSINDTSGNGFADWAANVNAWVHVSGATNAENNGAFNVTSKPNDSKLIVSGKTLVNESPGAFVTIRQNTQANITPQEIFDFTQTWTATT